MSQLVPVPVVDRLPAVPGALAHPAFTLDRHIDAGDHAHQWSRRELNGHVRP
jgi:hypothetical protein